MLLSILIPVYKYPCATFVSELHRQATELGISFEIIVADDGSPDDRVLEQNRPIALLPHARYFELDENHGRAWVRNWLLYHARGRSLLMADCDGAVCDGRFLARYLPWMGGDKVVCGGIIHPSELPSPHVSLRYRYEKTLEPRFAARIRNKRPHASLRTFNLMLPREVARRMPFDQRISSYGYEDTLLGAQMEQAGVPVVHIDNPLINQDIEDNRLFLAKTEAAMRTLSFLAPRMQGHSHLLRHYARLRRWHLAGLCALVFGLARPLMRRQLLGRHPCVWLFQAYKLGYFALIHKDQTSDKA